MSIERTYSLAKLAEDSGISVSTLNKWRSKGWLKPKANKGARDVFTEAAYDAACEASKRGNVSNIEAKPDPDFYKRLRNKYT